MPLYTFQTLKEQVGDRWREPIEKHGYDFNGWAVWVIGTRKLKIDFLMGQIYSTDSTISPSPTNTQVDDGAHIPSREWAWLLGEPSDHRILEFRPCMFCKMAASLRAGQDADGNWKVVCHESHGGCGATGPRWPDRAEAIAMWDKPGRCWIEDWNAEGRISTKAILASGNGK